MDLLKSMDSFIRVAAAGSFSRAAEQLGVSKSVLSKRIRDLEQEVDGRLIHRTTRRVRLTESGLKYLEFCRRILAEIERGHAQVSQLHKDPSGEIRLLAPKSFGNTLLADLVAEFTALYPRVRVSMILSDDLLIGTDQASSGVDLAVRLSPPRETALMVRRIGTLGWTLCAAPEYLAAAGTPRQPEDLRRHHCLHHLKVAPRGVWHMTAGSHEHTIKVSGRFAANSALALRAAALRGLGIASLPAYCIQADIESGALVPVLPDYSLPAQPVYALYTHRRQIPAKVRLLTTFLAERLRSPAMPAVTVELEPS